MAYNEHWYLHSLQRDRNALRDDGWTCADEIVHKTIVAAMKKHYPTWERPWHWKAEESYIRNAVWTIDKEIRGDGVVNYELIHETISRGQTGLKKYPEFKKASLRRCYICGKDNVRTGQHWFSECMKHRGAFDGVCRCGRSDVIFPEQIARHGCRIKQDPIDWPSHYSRCLLCIEENIKREETKLNCLNCGDYCGKEKGFCSDDCKKRFKLEKQRTSRGNTLADLQSTLIERMESSDEKHKRSRNVPGRY
jgi:predicted nucleic acid-binding Zn ribbon protein